MIQTRFEITQVEHDEELKDTVLVYQSIGRGRRLTMEFTMPINLIELLLKGVQDSHNTTGVAACEGQGQ